MVSSDFGKDDVRRHFTSGAVWAIAGAATAEAAAATDAVLMKVRRSMSFILPLGPAIKKIGPFLDSLRRTKPQITAACQH